MGFCPSLHYLSPQAYLLEGGVGQMEIAVPTWAWSWKEMIFVPQTWKAFIGWCSAATVVRFWDPCTLKVMARAKNSLSKDTGGDLKSIPFAHFQGAMWPNYMEEMFIPGCQGLQLSCSHFWKDAPQISGLSHRQWLLHFLPHSWRMLFLRASLANQTKLIKHCHDHLI